jgi:hypothetical protein
MAFVQANGGDSLDYILLYSTDEPDAPFYLTQPLLTSIVAVAVGWIGEAVQARHSAKAQSAVRWTRSKLVVGGLHGAAQPRFS